MQLFLLAETNIPDVVIDFIEVQLKSGETVSLNWDASSVARYAGGFEGQYFSVCFGEESASGRLYDLEGMEITDIGLYFETNGNFHFQIQEMEFHEGERLSFSQPAIPMDCDGMKALLLQQPQEVVLATKLVTFCKDYDFYGYQDSLQVGESEADAIHHMAQSLQSDPAARTSLVAQLSAIAEDEDLTPQQRAECTALMQAVSAFAPAAGMKISLAEQIRSAANRTTGAENDLPGKNNDRGRW